MTTHPTPEPDELPPVTVELSICAIAIHAFIETVGPRKGAKFLNNLERLADLYVDEPGRIATFRPRKDWPAVRENREKARAWVRKAVPTLRGVLAWRE